MSGPRRLSWSGPAPHRIALAGLSIGWILLLLYAVFTIVGVRTLGHVLGATGSAIAALALVVALFAERRERRRNAGGGRRPS